MLIIFFLYLQNHSVPLSILFCAWGDWSSWTESTGSLALGLPTGFRTMERKLVDGWQWRWPILSGSFLVWLQIGYDFVPNWQCSCCQVGLQHCLQLLEPLYPLNPLNTRADDIPPSSGVSLEASPFFVFLHHARVFVVIIFNSF